MVGELSEVSDVHEMSDEGARRTGEEVAAG